MNHSKRYFNWKLIAVAYQVGDFRITCPFIHLV